MVVQIHEVLELRGATPAASAVDPLIRGAYTKLARHGGRQQMRLQGAYLRHSRGQPRAKTDPGAYMALIRED